MLPIDFPVSLEIFKTLRSDQPHALADLLAHCLSGIQTKDGNQLLNDFFDQVFCLVQSQPQCYLFPLIEFLKHIRDVFKKPERADPQVTIHSSALLLPLTQCILGRMLKSIATIPQTVYLVATFVDLLVAANKCDSVGRLFLREIVDVPGAFESLLTEYTNSIRRFLQPPTNPAHTGHRSLQKLFVHVELRVEPLALNLVDRLHAFVRDCATKAKIPAYVETYMKQYDACETLLGIVQLQSAKLRSSLSLGCARAGDTTSERSRAVKIIVPKKGRNEDDHFFGSSKNGKKDAKQQQQPPQEEVMIFSATHLRCFKSIDVKPPSTFEQFKVTFSYVELVKFGLLQQYLDSNVFPNPDFHKFALNVLSDQHAVQEVEQGPISNSQSVGWPLSPSPTSPSFSLSDSLGQFGDDLGEWTILLSDKAVTGLHNLRSLDSFRVIKKKLQELASGVWTDDNAKPLMGGPTHHQSFGIKVYEAKTFRNQRIVWQVDVDYVQRLNANAQVIKVWAIGNHKDVSTIMNKYLWMVQLGYSEEHKKRCQMRSSSRRGSNGSLQQFSPLVFDRDVKKFDIEEAVEKQTLNDDDKVQLHNLRVTTKFFHLSKTVIKSILAGSTDFVFSVSPQEHEIMEYPSSAIVIGRSGTGKTTTIIFRMLGLYQAYHSNTGEYLYKSPTLPESKSTHLHQIFLTQSAVLCTRVRSHFRRLLESTDRASLPKEEILLAAKRRLMTDQDSTEDVMIEDDDGKELFVDVPINMNDLRDEHFPLFLTVTKFLEMLEVTYGIRRATAELPTRVPTAKRLSLWSGANLGRFLQNRMKVEDSNEESGESDADDDETNEGNTAKKDVQQIFDTQQAWAHYVTYEIFESKYWPRINKNYTNHLDCALVFTEIMSIIKGSEAVLSTEKGYLSREMYINLSQKAFPTLHYARETVYAIFQQYKMLKARFNDFDAPDRSFAILQAINRSGYHGVDFHQIYVDECQDNNVCDYAVMMKLISDPKGLFFAGDTAQAVARGSLFRFADLSSFVYRHEHQHPLVLTGHRKPVQPRLFQLTTNFRSHDGILKLGANIVQLLHHFFPSTVDVLDKEHGIVDGPKPIFFSDFTADSFLDLFCFGESSDQPIEFGSEQCIIVRDEAAKEKLQQRVRGMALVMTVYEAKGLEFTDTLLYNFWHDSPAHEKWDVVLSTIKGSNNRWYPQFDHRKHVILSDELKQLYVAVTRARSHLWIFDESGSSEPMKEVWLSNGLVKIVSKGDELPSLGTKSSSDEWDKQGRNLFERKQYEHAVFCFTKSNNQKARELSEAYMLRDKARRLVSQSASQGDVKDAFVKAALAFGKAQRPLHAAECYQDVEMYYEAGQCFERAKRFQQAVLIFKTGGHFDEAVDILNRKPNEVAVDIANKVRRIARINYSKDQQHDKALALSSMSYDELVKSYREHNMLQQLADLYDKKLKNYIKAGDVLQSLDRLQDAAVLYAKDVSQQGMVSALECYLTLASRNSRHLFETRNRDVRPITEFSSLYDQQNDIVVKAEHIINSLLSNESNLNSALNLMVHEVKLFRSQLGLLSPSHSQLDNSLDHLRDCAIFFHGKSIINEYRSLEVYIGFALETYDHNKISMDYWKSELHLLQALCDCVFTLLKATPQSSKDENWEELFCVDTINVVASTVDRRVHVQSPLIPIILGNDDSQTSNPQTEDQNKLLRPFENDPSFHLCTYEHVQLAARKLLCRRLWMFLEDSGYFARKFKFFRDPCVNQLILNNCRSQECKHEHIHRMDPEVFYKRRSLLLLQVNLMHNLSVLRYPHGVFLLEYHRHNYKPFLKYWKMEWVDANIFHTMEMESASVLRKIARDVPPLVVDELSNLVTVIWLKDPNPKDPDSYQYWNNFARITRAVLLIQAGMVHKTWIGWIRKKIYRLESQAARVFRDMPPAGIVSKNGRRRYWMVRDFIYFFETLNHGDLEKALKNGDEFIRFCLKNPNELELNPWDLIYTLEYTVTLLIFINLGGHGVVLPRSFLQFFVQDHIHYLLQSSLFAKDNILERLWSNASDTVILFFSLLASNTCMLCLLFFIDIWVWVTVIQTLPWTYFCLVSWWHRIGRFGLKYTMLQVLLARVVRLGIILSSNDTNHRLDSKITSYFRTTEIASISTRLFSRYLEAKSWYDMVGALQTQYRETNGMDELVLLKRGQGHIKYIAKDITVMQYEDADGFRAALCEYRDVDPVLAVGSPPVDDDQPINPHLVKDSDPIFHDKAILIQRCFRKHRIRRAEIASGTAYADAGLQEVFTQMKELANRMPGSTEGRLYAVMLRGRVAELYHEISKCKVEVDLMLNKVQYKLKMSQSDEVEWWLERSDECNEKRDLLQPFLDALSPENPLHMNMQPDRLNRDYDKAREILDVVKAWVEETSALQEGGKRRESFTAEVPKKKNEGTKKEKRPMLNNWDV
ncbi:hypothetical protein BC936DRAFT_144875 [Jimgerdemannia flammicorona]|uniref:UvrD-like helicase ATP-binding domain-containing protein n=1 Tax=Jimgerdemannia flammicorona TaxID=994334 RepID=A0A433DM57_9FUNG|nr:hypothetical protein BC936DRAFT_144875 [Jimgerdemannia flammicorona]